MLKIEEGKVVLNEIHLGELGDKGVVRCAIGGEEMMTEQQTENNVMKIKFRKQGIITPNSPLFLELR